MEKKLITLQMFDRSYFAIGPGFSLSALMRFSHLTTDFIFCNLFLTPQEVQDWYLKHFKETDDLLLLNWKCYEDFDELKHFELPTNYQKHLGQPAYFTKKDAELYLKTFKPAMGEPQVAFHFKVLKISTQKVLNLYYIFTEGLATLNLLSESGKRMCTVLENIQCGEAIDNAKDGLLARFFEIPGVKKPLMWVRGHQPFYSPNGFRSNALLNEGPMPEIGMDFSGPWNAGEFNKYWHRKGSNSFKRYVKGFVTKEKNLELQKALETMPTNEQHQIYVGNVAHLKSKLGPNDRIVMKKSLAEKLNWKDERVIYWNKITYSHYCFWLWHTATEMVEKMNEKIPELGFTGVGTLYVVPETTEDQGGLFLAALEELPYKTVACFYRPFEAYYTIQEKNKLIA